MPYCQLKTCSISYQLFGTKNTTIVIEAGLDTCKAEWLHIAETLSKDYQVLIYDRPGYGKSSSSMIKRSPENIASELHGLITKLKINNSLILLGHAVGGLYLQQYARMYPEQIKGLILLDPVTGFEHRFKEELSKPMYQGSGIDKTKRLKYGYYLTKIKLGFLLKSSLKKLPPFCYYDNFTNVTKKDLIRNLTRNTPYKTALEENRVSHDKRYIKHLTSIDQFPDIPLVVIYHTPSYMVDEIISYGKLNQEEAQKVEHLWEEITRSYLTYSSKSSWLQANNSGHYLHLTEFNLILEALNKI